MPGCWQEPLRSGAHTKVEGRVPRMLNTRAALGDERVDTTERVRGPQADRKQTFRTPCHKIRMPGQPVQAQSPLSISRGPLPTPLAPAAPR